MNKINDWRTKDVVVISKDDEFIYCCSPLIAEMLLKKKLVVVTEVNPFTIKLNDELTNQFGYAVELCQAVIDRRIAYNTRRANRRRLERERDKRKKNKKSK